MQLLTAEQVAEILQVSKFRVYEMVRLRLIPCVRMGRQIRFEEQTLKDWIAKGGSIANKDSERVDNKGGWQ